MSNQLSALEILFPNVNETILQTTLNSANGDVEMASNMILSEQEAISQMREKGQELSESDFESSPTLPSCPSSEGGNGRGRPESQKGAVNLKKRLYRPVHSFQKLENTGSTSAPLSQKKVWATSGDHVREIVSYTDVSSATAHAAFYKRSLDPARAVVDIIYHYEEYLSELEKSRSETTSAASQHGVENPMTKVGGRVQSSQGLAHSKQTNFDAKESTQTEGKQNTSVPAPQTSDTDYQNLEDELNELKTIVTSNPLLKAVSPYFLKTALRFYRGDVLRTTVVAAYIIENNCAQYTFIDASANTIPNENHESKLKSKSPVIPSDVGLHNHLLAPNSFASDANYEKALRICETMFETYTADLHGFLPHEAVLIAQTCLKRWWDEESNLRELNAHRINLIKAQNVASFKIITGRGLHSLGGISKVRIKIKRFLEESSYAYIEEASFFIIEGKRTVVLPKKR
ncbi:LANO_0D06106g1_1 [Lachancea nothofagi CBS 11611]|uniref:LANO_0D06106g1_1 n=1 Tax=Lachancea nothofagi CBS 11611 TaxID=1266666 RepID=A0A1G4JHZ3_9SACH|nr:LANO_0D06106g1_1 [Lachancea nothofagi CBS 11611]